MRAKAFNPQIFLEFLCYSVFAGLMLYLAGSGKYLSYVTPRMAPFFILPQSLWRYGPLRYLADCSAHSIKCVPLIALCW